MKNGAKTIEEIGEALFAMTNGSLKTMAGVTNLAGNRRKVLKKRFG